MIDETCTNCGAPLSAHLTTDRVTGRSGVFCPPRADGKVPVVVGHDIVDMDPYEHRAITRPRIEWRDPWKLRIPTFAAHLVRRSDLDGQRREGQPEGKWSR